MDLRRLTYFVAVAEARSFSKAAVKLHMSQPPLSQQVRSLEKDLGVQLFHRGSRGVVPTTAGNTLLVEARFLLRRYRQSWDTVRQSASSEKAGVSIGVITSALIGFVPKFIPRLSSLEPDIVPHIEEQQSAQQISLVRKGLIDIGIGRLRTPPDEMNYCELKQERLFVALPASHRLAQFSEIDVRELADENFSLYSRQTAPDAFDQILHYCVSAGFSPSVTSETVSGYGSVALVATGRWVTIVPEASTFLNMENVVFRPLFPVAHSVPLSLIFMDGGRSSVLNSVADIARSTDYL